MAPWRGVAHLVNVKADPVAQLDEAARHLGHGSRVAPGGNDQPL